MSRVDVGLSVFFAVLLVWGLQRPRSLVAVTVVLNLFLRTVVHLTGLVALDVVDDLCVLLLFAVVVLRLLAGRETLRWTPGTSWFLLFAGCGVAGALHRSVPLDVLLPGTYLAVKGYLFAWTISQLVWTRDHVRAAARLGAVVATFVFVCAVCNLLAPARWSAVFSVTGEENLRFGLPSLLGPFIHPLDLALFASLIAIAAGCYLQFVRAERPARRLTVVASVAVLLTFRRKELIGLALGVVFAVRGRRRLAYAGALTALTLVGVVILAPVLTGTATDLYRTYVTNGDAAARTVLTRDSFALARAEAPLAAGFGRFGSRTAAVHYSPEYVARGYPTVYGLGAGPREGQFLTDTQWPAVLGEAGFLGVFAYAAGLVALLGACRRLRRSGADPYLRWAGAVGVGWWTCVLVESVAAPVYNSPPGYLFVFGICGLAVGLGRGAADPLDAPVAAPSVRAAAAPQPSRVAL